MLFWYSSILLHVCHFWSAYAFLILNLLGWPERARLGHKDYSILQRLHLWFVFSEWCDGWVKCALCRQSRQKDYLSLSVNDSPTPARDFFFFFFFFLDAGHLSNPQPAFFHQLVFYLQKFGFFFFCKEWTGPLRRRIVFCEVGRAAGGERG